MHKCNECGKSELEAKFYWRTVSGRRYRAHLCNICQRKYKKRFKSDPAKVRAWNMKAHEKRTQDRLAGRNTARFILHDSRKSDKKAGRANDLDYEFVAKSISGPCCYCGEKEIRMTLDRIDNSLGHLRSNVNPACMRCNYLRRDMPFEAWEVIAIAVKEARNSGLFGDWVAGVRKSYVRG